MSATTPQSDIAGLGRRMGKGAAWTIAMRLAMRFLGLISTVILARLLVPADFGLVAMATMLSGLVMVLSAFSFNVALIQNQGAGRRHYDTAWTLSILRGFVAALLLLAVAEPAADFFRDERLTIIIQFLAAAALIEGFENIGVVDFQKHLNFHRDFQFMLGVKVVSFLVTVTLAVLWRNYWALVAGILSGGVMRVLLSYILHPYRPRFSLAKWRQIFGFSKWLLVNSILGFFYHRADTFLIGRMMSAGALGIYSVAYEIANMATTELIMPVRRALLPGFAKVAQDRATLTRLYLDSLALLVMIGAPVAIGLGLVADPLVRVFLGDKWLEAIPLIQVLVVYGLVNVLTSVNGSLFISVGRPRLITIPVGLGVVIVLPGLYWGISEHGLGGAVWVVAATAILARIADFVLVKRIIGVPIWRIGREIWRSVGALSLMIVVVYSNFMFWDQGTATIGLILVLATSVFAGVISYIGAHLLLWRMSGCPDGPEAKILQILSEKAPWLPYFVKKFL